MKQLLHKSPIRLPKTVKDRLVSKKPEQHKQNPQAPIDQAGKIQINTKVNNARPGSAFKLPST